MPLSLFPFEITNQNTSFCQVTFVLWSPTDETKRAKDCRFQKQEAYWMYPQYIYWDSKLPSPVACCAELVETGLLVRATCRVHSISTKTTKEGIKCTNVKE